MSTTRTAPGGEWDFSRVNGVIDDQTRAFFLQVLTDGGYIEENHEVKWEDGMMERVCQSIGTICKQVFNCDGTYPVFRPCSDSSITIDEMVANLREKLASDFRESPPFTILRVVELLTFVSKEIQVPQSANAILERVNNGAYTTCDKNVLSGSETRRESVNNYHRPSLEMEQLVRLNDVYAARYLFNLKRSIFVQSNSKRVLVDLTTLQSLNRIGTPAKMQGEVEKSDYPVKLERIPWLKSDKDLDQVSQVGIDQDDTGDSEKTENTTFNMDDEEQEEPDEEDQALKKKSPSPGIAPGSILFKIKGDVITENNLELFDSKIHQSSPKRTTTEHGDGPVVKRTRSSQKMKDELETSISNELENSPEICNTSVNTSLDQSLNILDSPHVAEESELEICS